MAKALNLLAYDFGASSGRAIGGAFDGRKIELLDIHRFENEPVMLGGTLFWDTPRLFHEIKVGLAKAVKQGFEPSAIGIDTWGVDFGLLDLNDALLGFPVHYRDARTNNMMEAAFEVVPKRDMFDMTGLAFMQFNTVYQLLAMKLSHNPALASARTMLMMPDLLAFFLTGEKATEYTIASTSQLIDPRTRAWRADLLEKLGLPTSVLTPIQQPGLVRGQVTGVILEEVGASRQVPVVTVGSHDTASAVAAVPASHEKFAYLSSGTWSLLGVELDAPIIAPSVLGGNYTNEGGVCGKTRMLKNIMGLWIIQECKREWDRRGEVYSFGELVDMAAGAPEFLSVIDVDDDLFIAPGNMPARVRQYCADSGQAVPETHGQLARVVYESLALKYRWTLERLEQDILGYSLSALNIVGGGSKNEMLNQFTANAIGWPVIAGPSEGTAIGNLLVQAMALGELSDLSELREVVRASFDVKEYSPFDGAKWDDAYERLRRLMGK